MPVPNPRSRICATRVRLSCQAKRKRSLPWDLQVLCSGHLGQGRVDYKACNFSRRERTCAWRRDGPSRPECVLRISTGGTRIAMSEKGRMAGLPHLLGTSTFHDGAKNTRGHFRHISPGQRRWLDQGEALVCSCGKFRQPSLPLLSTRDGSAKTVDKIDRNRHTRCRLLPCRESGTPVRSAAAAHMQVQKK